MVRLQFLAETDELEAETTELWYTEWNLLQVTYSESKESAEPNAVFEVEKRHPGSWIKPIHQCMVYSWSNQLFTGIIYSTSSQGRGLKEWLHMYIYVILSLVCAPENVWVIRTVVSFQSWIFSHPKKMMIFQPKSCTAVRTGTGFDAVAWCARTVSYTLLQYGTGTGAVSTG